MITDGPAAAKTMSARKRCAFAIAAIALSLGLLELSARAIELVRARRGGPDAATAVVRRLRPLRYELEPGAGLPANGEVARINPARLRGADPETPKRRTRVLCLGDSCTFGYAPGVTDDATYPAVLARRLDPARFEVINGGMPGFGSLDSLGFLLHKGLALEPDVVVILAGWNDYAHVHQVDDRPTPASPLRILEGSALVTAREARDGETCQAEARPLRPGARAGPARTAVRGRRPSLRRGVRQHAVARSRPWSAPAEITARCRCLSRTPTSRGTAGTASTR